MATSPLRTFGAKSLAGLPKAVPKPELSAAPVDTSAITASLPKLKMTGAPAKKNKSESALLVALDDIHSLASKTGVNERRYITEQLTVLSGEHPEDQ